MIDKLNKYYVLIKHVMFSFEQLNKMSEYEKDSLYNKILTKINK
jgi:hypothetical protein